MEKQVSSRKFRTTVVAMCLGFLMVIGAIIGVWAATTQNYKAGFNVTYSVGDNVTAKVRTEYYIPNADLNEDGYEDGAITVTANKAGDTVTAEDGYVHFGSGEDTSEKSVEIGNLKLTPQTPKVYFYFTINSLMSNNFVQVIVNENYTSKQNIKVTTDYYNTASFTSSSSASILSNSAYVSSPYENVIEQGFKIIRVELAVINTNKPATIEGDISLGLYFSREEENLALLSKSALSSASSSFGTFDAMTFAYAQSDASYQTTGTDVSDAGDGSIWAYKNGTTVYVLSKDTIVFPEDSSSMFSSLSVSNLNVNNVDTSSVKNMAYMFYSCSKLTSIDLSKFNTSSAENMSRMFFNCSSLTSLDLSMFDTSNVLIMGETMGLLCLGNVLWMQ